MKALHCKSEMETSSLIQFNLIETKEEKNWTPFSIILKFCMRKQPSFVYGIRTIRMLQARHELMLTYFCRQLDNL